MYYMKMKMSFSVMSGLEGNGFVQKEANYYVITIDVLSEQGKHVS